MYIIKTKAELIELHFQELEESEPCQEVGPSFLLRFGGLCYGVSYGEIFWRGPLPQRHTGDSPPRS